MAKTKNSMLLPLALLLSLIFSFCAKAQTTKTSISPTATFAFSKGADVSWLPQMEATGYKFYDIDGTEKDCLQLLKDRGMNTIRLRV